MASNSRRDRRDRKPSQPPAVARRPRPRPGMVGDEPAPGSVRAMVEAEDLGMAYAHVRRDLTRIAVFGVMLFALIFASKLIY
ncbi:MAG: hypothetical protein H6648_10270 [Caldilineae bacterium]|nr:hypothetical protein [Chloroflexota bacterium]MCB9177536.1 hypothetical protein [Caldilineae bacterium]